MSTSGDELIYLCSPYVSCLLIMLHSKNSYFVLCGKNICVIPGLKVIGQINAEFIKDKKGLELFENNFITVIIF